MIFVNKNSEWLPVAPQVNVDDVWFPCKAVFVRANDQWNRVYGRVAEIIQFPVRNRWTEGVQQDVCISAACG